MNAIVARTLSLEKNARYPREVVIPQTLLEMKRYWLENLRKTADELRIHEKNKKNKKNRWNRYARPLGQRKKS